MCFLTNQLNILKFKKMKKLILTVAFLTVSFGSVNAKDLEVKNNVNIVMEESPNDPCFIIGNMIFDVYGETPEAVALANAICAAL